MSEPIVCPVRCAVCDGDGYVLRETPQGTTYYPTCEDCGGIGSVFGHVACGWAFDAGMREAERDRAQETARLGFFLHDVLEEQSEDDVSAAVAAERERCAAWVWQASAAADENVIGDEDVAAWAIERIKSGAPAPREG